MIPLFIFLSVHENKTSAFLLSGGFWKWVKQNTKKNISVKHLPQLAREKLETRMTFQSRKTGKPNEIIFIFLMPGSFITKANMHTGGARALLFGAGRVFSASCHPILVPHLKTSSACAAESLLAVGLIPNFPLWVLSKSPLLCAEQTLFSCYVLSKLRSLVMCWANFVLLLCAEQTLLPCCMLSKLFPLVLSLANSF